MVEILRIVYSVELSNAIAKDQVEDKCLPQF